MNEIVESYRNGRLIAHGRGVHIVENERGTFDIRYQRLQHTTCGVRYGWAPTYVEALVMVARFHKRNTAKPIEPTCPACGSEEVAHHAETWAAPEGWQCGDCGHVDG